MFDTSVIYYTSNKENKKFEQKIMERLIQVNLPIITVSQKPVNIGKNIVVGDIGASDGNAFKQMLIGCEAAETPFVIFAEADTLYPPEYFTYRPPVSDYPACPAVLKRYWFEPVYVMYHNKEGFFLKGRSDCGHMAGRKLAIKLLKEGGSKGMRYKGEDRPTKVILKNPIINIKTGDGMRPKTQTGLIPVTSLPYWGKASKLRKEYCA